MSLSNLQEEITPQIESSLHEVLDPLNKPPANQLYDMLAYHMGWIGEGAGPKASGKRIRPLLVALAAGAAGGDWQDSLPAGVAVELLHNFSLIHDDIEDHSPLRRGRPTLWKIWGIPQAINTGDAMFSLANRTILNFEETTSERVALAGAKLLQETCLDLTRGQFLDISYENRTDLTTKDYWPMVGGKTAALLRCCAELGAMAGGSELARQSAFGEFGYNLGLAFQVQDDLLGIWGDPETTGKSSASDLVEGKNSLPVLFGLSQQGEFAHHWEAGNIQADEVAALATLLASEGALEFTRSTAADLTTKARQALDLAVIEGEAATALYELLDYLLNRNM